MNIIAMTNQKGGVGKTSTCHHLAGELARRGRMVLLIDYDPQRSLTNGLIGRTRALGLLREETAAMIASGQEPDPSSLIMSSGLRHISLVAGSRDLATYNVPQPHLLEETERSRLRDFVEACVDLGYDDCLIDCHPDMNALAYSALTAASHYCVPTQAEDYAAQGLAETLDFADQIQSIDNPILMQLGIVITMFDAKTRQHHEFDADIREAFAGSVFSARVPRSIVYAESISARLPVCLYKPRSKAAKAIEALASEYLERVESTSSESQPRTGTKGVA
jgi:chromosome partitioning protein